MKPFPYGNPLAFPKSFKDILDDDVYNTMLELTKAYKTDDKVQQFFNLLHGDIFHYDDNSSFCIYIGNEKERHELDQQEKSLLLQETPKFYLQIIIRDRLFCMVILIENGVKNKKGWDRYYYDMMLDNGETNTYKNLETITEKFLNTMAKSKTVSLRCEFLDKGTISERKNREMQTETANEVEKLKTYETICYKALTTHQKNNASTFNEIDKSNLFQILKESFETQKNFLVDYPDTYFDSTK